MSELGFYMFVGVKRRKGIKRMGVRKREYLDRGGRRYVEREVKAWQQAKAEKDEAIPT